MTEISKANTAFFEAIRRSDAVAMASLWSRSEGVSCVFPSAPFVIGYEAIVENWKKVLAGMWQADIDVEEISSTVSDKFALVISWLGLPHGRFTVANVFRRESGGWKLLHHHAGVVERRHDHVARLH